MMMQILLLTLIGATQLFSGTPAYAEPAMTPQIAEAFLMARTGLKYCKSFGEASEQDVKAADLFALRLKLVRVSASESSRIATRIAAEQDELARMGKDQGIPYCRAAWRPLFNTFFFGLPKAGSSIPDIPKMGRIHGYLKKCENAGLGVPGVSKMYEKLFLGWSRHATPANQLAPNNSIFWE